MDQGTAGAGGFAASAGSAGTNAGSGGAAGAAGAVGGAPATGISGNGGASTAGSGGVAAGSVTAAQLFPLAVGNRWTYQVTSTAADCPSGSHDASIVGTMTEGNETAFDFRDYCEDSSPTYLRAANDEVLEYQVDWARSLAQPVQDGYSWMFTQNFTLTWHAAGTVTVPAGTFQNCWDRLSMSGATLVTKTYCPDVGPVKESGFEDVVLTSYSLK